MRKKYILKIISTGLLVWLGVFIFSFAQSQVEVAILMSKDIGMYREAASALAKALSGNKTKIFILPSGKEEAVQAVLQEVQKENPKVIVAVGAKAASEAMRTFPRVPLVYLMVVNPERLDLINRDNVYGVSWSPSPQVLAQTVHLLLPNAKRIGMLSSVPSDFTRSLAEDLQKSGLELVIAPVKDISGVPQGLRNLHGKIDLLWMGSDPALATESAFDILRFYCVQNKLPLLVPISLVSHNGVLAGISIAPNVAGAEAAKLVQQLLDGKKPKERLVWPDNAHLALNLATAKAIGTKLSDASIKTANEVYDK